MAVKADTCTKKPVHCLPRKRHLLHCFFLLLIDGWSRFFLKVSTTIPAPTSHRLQTEKKHAMPLHRWKSKRNIWYLWRPVFFLSCRLCVVRAGYKQDFKGVIFFLVWNTNKSWSRQRRKKWLMMHDCLLLKYCISCSFFFLLVIYYRKSSQ